MNALKHGDRSADRIESRRLANVALKLLREEDDAERREMEQLTDTQKWIQRIAVELRGNLP